MKPQTTLEKVVAGVGSPLSLVIHTLIFAGFFVSAAVGLISFDMMLLFLTTIVSLEAIYLAIFIQMTVNQHTQSLREVEEDIDEIQEDVEEIGEDIDELQEDVEEISEDLDEIQEDVEEMSEEEAAEAQSKKNAATLEQLTGDIRRILADLESLKKDK